MQDASKNQSYEEILSRIGPDATAMFDNSATVVNGRDAELEEEDDDAAALEEDDELDEEEEVEDEAGVR
jgi:hypothetical protein